LRSWNIFIIIWGLGSQCDGKEKCRFYHISFVPKMSLKRAFKHGTMKEFWTIANW